MWEARRPEIERMYLTELKSQTQVAAHFGVTLAAIQKVMARLGIPSRSRGNMGPRNGRYRHGKATTIYRAMVRKTNCLRCGATEDLCVHHKDEDHYNNTPSNLEVLCMSCHSKEHKKAWWDAKKAG